MACCRLPASNAAAIDTYELVEAEGLADATPILAQELPEQKVVHPPAKTPLKWDYDGWQRINEVMEVGD